MIVTITLNFNGEDTKIVRDCNFSKCKSDEDMGKILSDMYLTLIQSKEDTKF